MVSVEIYDVYGVSDERLPVGNVFFLFGDKHLNRSDMFDHFYMKFGDPGSQADCEVEISKCWYNECEWILLNTNIWNTLC